MQERFSWRVACRDSRDPHALAGFDASSGTRIQTQDFRFQGQDSMAGLGAHLEEALDAATPSEKYECDEEQEDEAIRPPAASRRL